MFFVFSSGGVCLDVREVHFVFQDLVLHLCLEKGDGGVS